MKQKVENSSVQIKTPAAVFQQLDQSLVDVVCPHPGCEENAFAPAPRAEKKITVTRSAALFGDYSKVHCPEGHKAFVHYC